MKLGEALKLDGNNFITVDFKIRREDGTSFIRDGLCGMSLDIYKSCSYGLLSEECEVINKHVIIINIEEVVK